MYQLSRAIYRELSPHICTGREGHADVLTSCERAIERLATDRHYFSNPARTLFRDVRANFPLQAQERVWIVVRDYVEAAERMLASLTTRGRDAFGKACEKVRMAGVCSSAPCIPHQQTRAPCGGRALGTTERVPGR